MSRTQIILFFFQTENSWVYPDCTTIRYFIPQTVARAELRITDAAGRLLKAIPVDGRGAGQTVLQAHSLSAGAYAYSLVIDGQIIETRQMVLTR